MVYFRCGDAARAGYWYELTDRPAATWQERADVELLLREAPVLIDRPPGPARWLADPGL